MGAAATDRSGYSVGAAGDVNGDGVDDIIIGAPLADPPNGADAGIAYVIFGRSLALQVSYPFSDIQLTNGVSALHSSVGFRILGAAIGDWCGFYMSAKLGM